MKNWHGIMKIEEIIHSDANGKELYKEENVLLYTVNLSFLTNYRDWKLA
jgi:hypothetical protein